MTADSTIAEIEASGDAAIGIEVDVRNHAAVEAMAARVVQEWGRVDVLVANAGGGRGRPVDTTKASTLGGRDRRIGCVELLDFYLARAERHNPTLNAIIVWQIDQARERARAADDALARGERWGPLHGLPMTVKESFNVAGLPTTFGNPLWKDNIAADNAFLIDRLLQAGAIVFGKTNVPYMLADAQSYNDIYGTTNNNCSAGSWCWSAAPRLYSAPD